MEEKQRKRMDRSSFAVTCSLLSQYLKERSSGDPLGIERLHCPPAMEKATFCPPTTMNLFPGSNISSNNRNEPVSEKMSEQTSAIPANHFTQHQDTDSILKSAKSGDPKESEVNAQLTILYDGKVMVFDNFPARKARDLMVMAGKAKSFLPRTETTPTFADPSASDLTMPLARKASLHRFLEKRKDRIRFNAPYSVHGSREPDSGLSEPEKNPAWLELGRF